MNLKTSNFFPLRRSVFRILVKTENLFQNEYLDSNTINTIEMYVGSLKAVEFYSIFGSESILMNFLKENHFVFGEFRKKGSLPFHFQTYTH